MTQSGPRRWPELNGAPNGDSGDEAAAAVLLDGTKVPLLVAIMQNVEDRRLTLRALGGEFLVESSRAAVTFSASVL